MVIVRQDFQILTNQELIVRTKVVQRADLIEEQGFLSSKHLVHPVELPWLGTHRKHWGERIFLDKTFPNRAQIMEMGRNSKSKQGNIQSELFHSAPDRFSWFCHIVPLQL